MAHPKLYSGRLWLTVISGLVFGWCAVTGKLSGEAVASLLAAVFTSYFNKKSNGDTK